ncbi:MAG: CRISPR-associated endonuclease Cas1, partial [Abditibacteriales bacterium]|nr:CRISPR-associated endonuclease Cas1 [Abditibacteriales bacterium]
GVRPEWVQLCAEAMLLEEHTSQRIEKGYVYYTASKARREVIFTDALREKVREAIARAWHVLDAGVVPDPVADARCPGCAFFALCQPHEVKFLEGKGPPPPQRIIPQDTLARTVYVDEQGASVHKRGGKIVVEKTVNTSPDVPTSQRCAEAERVKLLEVPAISIDQLVLVGNVQISTQTLKFLLRANVEVIYLSTHGRFEGRFVPEFHKNVHLRLRQHDLHKDTARCLGLSRQFVFGKLSNMRTMLLRYGRSLNDTALTTAAREVESALRQVSRAADTETLMGLEGQGSRAYFRVFGRLIRRKEWGFDFEKRTRRPPQDPVNALLGFAYALLLADVIAGCSAAGLDPYIGFFHSPRYGRPALALDLMEEFRPIVADSVVLSLINKGMVEPHHFEQKMGGVFLNEAGREVFYRAYSQRKHEQITHPVFKYKLPYHRIFELQARFLAKVVTGDLEEYVPFAVR